MKLRIANETFRVVEQLGGNTASTVLLEQVPQKRFSRRTALRRLLLPVAMLGVLAGEIRKDAVQ